LISYHIVFEATSSKIIHGAPVPVVRLRARHQIPAELLNSLDGIFIARIGHLAPGRGIHKLFVVLVVDGWHTWNTYRTPSFLKG